MALQIYSFLALKTNKLFSCSAIAFFTLVKIGAMNQRLICCLYLLVYYFVNATLCGNPNNYLAA